MTGEGGAPDGNGVVGSGGPGDGIGVFGGGSGFREGVHGAGGPDNGTGVFSQASGNGPGAARHRRVAGTTSNLAMRLQRTPSQDAYWTDRYSCRRGA